MHLSTIQHESAHRPWHMPAGRWLTERYCAYVSIGTKLYRYDIHHAEWGVKPVQLQKLSLDYRIGALHLHDGKPDPVHFSEGVKVLAWPRQLLLS